MRSRTWLTTPSSEKHDPLSWSESVLISESGRNLLDMAIGSQTQKMIFDWAHAKDSRARETTLLLDLEQGRSTWRHPAFLQGLELVREIGRHLQPGYMQLRREDANFAFAARRALMVFVSSQDAASLRSMTSGKIDVVAFPVPYPTHGHSRFGRYALGPLTE
jgi:hypothetical protein